ncbi:hypothetical protein ACFSWE_07090 [Leucobacter albus]|uniref:Uncharacterized protein n=1 Tax=Leucobacter albus TaxID=272210 RepID=A0ABW3TK05_9MICO
MLLSLWLMSQFLLITLLVAFGAAQPQSPAQLALLGATCLLALAPVVTAIVCARRIALAFPLPSLTSRSRRASFRTFRVAADPGTPGAALARAPSRVVSSLD